MEKLPFLRFFGKTTLDPTNSVKALKEVEVLSIGFNPTRSTSLYYNTTHACNNTHTKLNESKHSRNGPSETKPIPENC